MGADQPSSFFAAFSFFFAWREKAFGISDFKFLVRQRIWKLFLGYLILLVRFIVQINFHIFSTVCRLASYKLFR